MLRVHGISTAASPPTRRTCLTLGDALQSLVAAIINFASSSMRILTSQQIMPDHLTRFLPPTLSSEPVAAALKRKVARVA